MAQTAPDAREGTGSSRIPLELEAFFATAEKWHLSTDQQIVLLGSPGRSTFFKWKKDGGQIPQDTMERISHVLSIWKALKILFTIEDRGCDWLRRKNTFFDDATALDVMLGGTFGDLYRVRSYLDAQRGG